MALIPRLAWRRRATVASAPTSASRIPRSAMAWRRARAPAPCPRRTPSTSSIGGCDGDPHAMRESDRLGAGSDLELGEDVGDVKLDGALADEQPCGDVAVAQPRHHQFEHLALTVAQLGQASPGRRLRCGGTVVQREATADGRAPVRVGVQADPAAQLAGQAADTGELALEPL